MVTKLIFLICLFEAVEAVENFYISQETCEVEKILEEVADIESDMLTKSAALIKGPAQGMAIPTTGVLLPSDHDLQFALLLNDLEPWTKYVLNYRVSKKCTVHF